MIIPSIYASQGKVSPLSSQFMRTLACSGRGRVLEKVTSVASEGRAAVSAVITTSRSGSISGSYFLCSKRLWECRLDPCWFGVPTEQRDRFSITVNLDLSSFTFPASGPHRNISSWLDGKHHMNAM